MESNGFVIGPGIKEIWASKVSHQPPETLQIKKGDFKKNLIKCFQTEHKCIKNATKK